MKLAGILMILTGGMMIYWTVGNLGSNPSPIKSVGFFQGLINAGYKAQTFQPGGINNPNLGVTDPNSGVVAGFAIPNSAASNPDPTTYAGAINANGGGGVW